MGDFEDLKTAIEGEFPGWQVWRSDAGRWYATRSGDLTDAQLQIWLDQHMERYGKPTTISFDQVYLGRGEHGGHLQKDAAAIAAKLAMQPDLHHDRDLAHKKGSADIFLNINTSLGLMERYVTDWLGPEALVRALRVKLGAPAYPYNHLTFTGSVQSVDEASGRAVVAVTAKNKLGSHISGTVEVELPRGPREEGPK